MEYPQTRHNNFFWGQNHRLPTYGKWYGSHWLQGYMAMAYNI